MNVDWLDIIVGSVVGLAVSFVPILLVRIRETVSNEKPPSSIDGQWFSAEYDIKHQNAEERLTILCVNVRRTITRRVVVEYKDAIRTAREDYPTRWKVVGTMKGEVLVGEWTSTVPDSLRHGSVLLKFCDNGRAIGFYLGYVEKPVVGYWLMARKPEVLEALVRWVHPTFPDIDLKAAVDRFDSNSTQAEAAKSVVPDFGNQ